MKNEKMKKVTTIILIVLIAMLLASLFGGLVLHNRYGIGIIRTSGDSETIAEFKETAPVETEDKSSLDDTPDDTKLETEKTDVSETNKSDSEATVNKQEDVESANTNIQDTTKPADKTPSTTKPETNSTENNTPTTKPVVTQPASKLVPNGNFTYVDMSAYNDDEKALITTILGKIKTCNTHNLKEEIIPVDTFYDYYSYHKVASFFYVYYGQKRAVDETFDIINYQNGDGTKTVSIRMRYDDIRQFEATLNDNKAKIDRILSTFTDGSEQHILNQIAQYLGNNMVYTDGHYDLSSALNGKGVCNAYALVFNAMANRAGITSNVCIGKVNDEYHAWNRVTLSDGEYRYYDITFYDTGGNTKYLNSKINFHSSYLVDNYADCWTKK